MTFSMQQKLGVNTFFGMKLPMKRTVDRSRVVLLVIIFTERIKSRLNSV
jgi:hypothetical protein